MPFPLGGNGQLDVLFLVLILFIAAIGLGTLARRLGQPAILGELAAGVLLGPSVTGALWPGFGDQLAEQVSHGAVGVLAGIGAVLLLTSVGAEVDLPLVSRLWRRHAAIPAGTLLVPLVLGVGLGAVAPRTLGAVGGSRVVLMAFVGVFLAVSALPVVARVLVDLGWVRRDLGQLALATATADDLVGWVLIGILAGVAGEGSPEVLVAVAAAVLMIAVLVVLLRYGHWPVDALSRRAARFGDDAGVVVTAMTVLALVTAAQAVGLDGLVGAFVAGVLLRRSPARPERALRGVAHVGRFVMGPLFFAALGTLVDVRAIGEPVVLAWTAAVVVVAVASKLAGAWLGGLVAGPSRPVALAVGAAVSARGGMGVIVASVGLTSGVLSETAFTSLVIVSILTSMVAGPLTRRLLESVPEDPAESERLAQEALAGESILASARRVLLPTRGGLHARVAARILDLSLDPSASVSVLHVTQGPARVRGAPSPAVGPGPEAKQAVDEVAALLGHRHVEKLVWQGEDVGRVLADEARHGYQLVAVGASQAVRSGQQLSDTLQHVLATSPAPVMIVRSGTLEDGLRFGRVVTPATGTRFGQAAEELAYGIAARTGAEVDLVHVVSRSDRMLDAAWFGGADDHPVALSVLRRAAALAQRFGATAATLTRVGTSVYEQLLVTAEEREADVIVLATPVRSLEGRPFLGHGVEYLLEHATQTLVVVAFPSR